VGIYVALMLAVGMLVAGKSSSLGDFAVTGRNMSLTVCSISIVATWFGAGPMMGSAAAAYAGNTLEVLRDPIVSGISLLIAGFFFARTYRRSRRYTHIDFYENRIGGSAAVLSVVLNLIGGIMWLGAVLFAFGVVFETLTGQPAMYGVVGGTLVIVVYTMFGGLKAVAATDVLQMVFIIVGVLVLFFVVIDDAGGWATVSRQLPEHAFDFSPPGTSFKDYFDYFQVWLSSGLVAIGVVSVVQRSMAARTEQVAQNSLYLAGFAYLLFGMIPVTLGYVATITMPGVDDTNAIIPLLAVEHLHPIVVAVFVGAVVSAIMSTSDSILLGCGTIISVRLLPIVKTEPSEAMQLAVARWSVPVLAIFAIFTAFNTATVISMIGLSISLGFASMTGPYLLVIWWKKLNKPGGFAGIVGGLMTLIIASSLWPDLPASFIAFCVSLPTAVIVSLLTQGSHPPMPLRDIDGEPLDLKQRLGTLPLLRRVD
jgi:SSS family transporter